MSRPYKRFNNKGAMIRLLCSNTVLLLYCTTGLVIHFPDVLIQQAALSFLLFLVLQIL